MGTIYKSGIEYAGGGGGGQSYTAGNGIEIDNNVISTEATTFTSQDWEGMWNN